MLSNNHEPLRIWEHGGIRSVSEDFFDQLIIQTARNLHEEAELNGFMKSARLIGEVMGHLKQYVGETFLEYRVRRLIEAGEFEAEGSLEAMRFYSVRLKQ